MDNDISGQPYFDQMTGQWVQPTGPDPNQVGFQIDSDWLAPSTNQINALTIAYFSKSKCLIKKFSCCKC